MVAGQRAHALQQQLHNDVVTAQADRDARQADMDHVNTDMAQVQSGLDDLAVVQGRLDDLSGQMADLIGRIQDAAATITDQPASVTAALAQLMEQQEQNLIQESNAVAWAQANARAGLVADLRLLPAGVSPAGLHLSWPLHGVITQPFGPTNFQLEPPLGSSPHFHTGVDVAAALGSPVRATADGVVVAVAHTGVGYGNYVIIAHGSGVLSLYGHLLATDVNVGEKVVRGQRIGREGSSGLSTGPHLHFEVRINGQVANPMRYLPSA
jgi:murein DD-endopeptidase MepM/ murein hydrolase activator NlpD